MTNFSGGSGTLTVGEGMTAEVTSFSLEVSRPHPYPQLKAWAERKAGDRFVYKPIYPIHIDAESPVTASLVGAFR